MEYEMTYADKVGKVILELPMGEDFIIARKVKPENKDKFIEVVKSYIDRNFGNNEGWEVIFSSDYTKLKKIKA